MVEGQSLSQMLGSQGAEIHTEMKPQNVSNGAWTSATLQPSGAPVTDMLAQTAVQILNELDLQGSANMAWTLSTMLLADSFTFLPLSDRLLCSPLLDIRIDWDHVANELTHICQLAWAFSFASCLSHKLGQRLNHLLIGVGERLDSDGPPDYMVDPQGLPSSHGVSESAHMLPRLVVDLQGISVVFKPPYWEVDAKGKLSGSRLYLSNYMQGSYPSSRVVRMAAFEYGFIHRLDIPSSGLVLAGTSFRGLAALQWQMHTYSISWQLRAQGR